MCPIPRGEISFCISVTQIGSFVYRKYFYYVCPFNIFFCLKYSSHVTSHTVRNKNPIPTQSKRQNLVNNNSEHNSMNLLISLLYSITSPHLTAFSVVYKMTKLYFRACFILIYRLSIISDPSHPPPAVSHALLNTGGIHYIPQSSRWPLVGALNTAAVTGCASGRDKAAALMDTTKWTNLTLYNIFVGNNSSGCVHSI